jgi:hypothetical protein
MNAYSTILRAPGRFLLLSRALVSALPTAFFSAVVARAHRSWARADASGFFSVSGFVFLRPMAQTILQVDPRSHVIFTLDNTTYARYIRE